MDRKTMESGNCLQYMSDNLVVLSDDPSNISRFFKKGVRISLSK